MGVEEDGLLEKEQVMRVPGSSVACELEIALGLPLVAVVGETVLGWER
jgi:hypothetical protein